MISRSAVVCVLVAIACCSFGGCGRKRHAAPAARVLTTPAVPTPAPVKTTEFGLASWYGHPYHGRAAADGEIYDMEKLTAAHRTLPFNTWVRVTNLANTKAIEVRIIDRGPFIDGRIVDLSHAAAQAIDLIGPGVAQVRLDVIEAPVNADAVAGFAVQVGAFQDRERAERVRASYAGQFGSARLVLRDGNPRLWRVLVGSERSFDAASLIASRIETSAGPAFVVRLDQ